MITYPTKMQVRNATIGIRTLLLIKSKKSKMDIPNGLMKSQAPNPREDGIPMSTMPINTIRQVMRRFQWNLSCKIETTVSIREMEEVRAANNTNKKNAEPITPPSAYC